EIAAEAGVDLPSPADLAPAIGANLAASGDTLEAIRQALTDSLLKQHLNAPRVIAASSVPLALSAASTPDYGARLVGIDRDLRTRLMVAANDAMTRAQERAGNKLRSKANADRELLKQVPPHRVFATLGSRALSFVTEEDALAGAWDDLERQFFAW